MAFELAPRDSRLWSPMTASGPTGRTPWSRHRSPTLGKESALYVVNHPKATPRCGSQLHGGPRTLRSMRSPELAPRAGAKVESWTTREGRPHRGPCPALLEPRTSMSESAYPHAKPTSWAVLDSAPTFPLPTRDVACRDFVVYLGVLSAATCHRTGGGCTGRHSPTNPPVPLRASPDDQGLGRDSAR